MTKKLNLGRPTDNKGAQRRQYVPAQSADVISVRMTPSAAGDASEPQRAIVIYGDGTVSAGDDLKSGRVEMRLDDRDAALLASDLINQLSPSYLATLYSGLDPKRGNIFKAFRCQFRQDTAGDSEAFMMAAEYNPGR